jgi:DnaJ-class molecular chaperone
MKDHFNTLGVAPDASDEEIKRAYKKLAMKHHPDRGGDQAKFQEIQEAYDTLSDSQKRAQWEQEKQFGGGGGGPGGFHFNFGFGPDINDIFRQFTGGGFRQPPRNRDLRLAMEIDLVSTLEEQKHHINVQHYDGNQSVVEVTIPRGVASGMQMKFAGKGDHSNKSLQPGDLYIEFRVRQHPEFRINGIHLTKTVTMDCIDAMLGAKINVTALDGKEFEINTPPATQHGSRFRINGQGLWEVNRPIRGDLFVEVALRVPVAPTSEQMAKLQQLNKQR